MKATLFILILFVAQIAFAQNQKTEAQNGKGFYFYYGTTGLGSNLWYFFPTLRIYGDKFTYTNEQNSYRVKRRSKKVEFISEGFVHQSSIDSILSLIQALKDTEIYKFNPCIMSGVITHIKIAFGNDTTKFTLDNTSDVTALKIISIINPYLPEDKKLYGSEKEIKEEEDCMNYLNKEAKRYKDSIDTHL